MLLKLDLLLLQLLSHQLLFPPVLQNPPWPLDKLRAQRYSYQLRRPGLHYRPKKV